MKTLNSFKRGDVIIKVCMRSVDEIFANLGSDFSKYYCVIEQYGKGESKREKIFNFDFSNDSNKKFVELISWWLL